MLLHWCIGEGSWEEFQPVHPKGNQSWIFIGRTDADAEVPILWPLIRRKDSLEKTLMLGKIKDRRRRRWQRIRWLDGITDSMDMSLSTGHEFEQLRELVMDREGWHVAVHEVAKSWMPLNNWTDWLIPPGFPGGASGKEPTCQCRRSGFDLWVKKIPCRKAWQPTPVFLPGESHGQSSLAGHSP